MKVTEDKVFRYVPIIISKLNDGYHAEIADNYEDYKTMQYKDINFEDLAFHFGFVCHYIFDTRKEAKFESEFTKRILKEKGINAKIWLLD